MTTRRMPAADAVFLQGETDDVPMHVAALMQFELPDGAGEDFVADLVTRLRRYAVLQRPWNQVLTTPRRLQWRPQLREVESADMEYHVRHLALPRPGGERELGQLVARLHSQCMDLRKPLWECHVIEGLAQRRFALYVKLHHALVDGVSAARLLTRALASDPAAMDALPFWAVGSGAAPRKPGANGETARGRPLPAARAFLEAGRAASRLLLDRGDDVHVTLRTAPRSVLNGRIVAQRRFATHTVPIARLKRIAKVADASLNDIVLTMTGTALRDYLSGMDALPAVGLTASIPVSMREADDQSTGNAVSLIFATMGTHIVDDRSRVEAIKASTQAAKARIRALSPAAQKMFPLFLMGPVAGPFMTGLAGRTRPPFNITVSNVPGCSEERYLFGARLANSYPVSIPIHGSALNVTCCSHAGQMNFGLTACRDSVPHVQRLAVSLGRAVDRLEDVFGLPRGS